MAYCPVALRQCKQLGHSLPSKRRTHTDLMRMFFFFWFAFWLHMSPWNHLLSLSLSPYEPSLRNCTLSFKKFNLFARSLCLFISALRYISKNKHIIFSLFIVSLQGQFLIILQSIHRQMLAGGILAKACCVYLRKLYTSCGRSLRRKVTDSGTANLKMGHLMETHVQTAMLQGKLLDSQTTSPFVLALHCGCPGTLMDEVDHCFRSWIKDLLSECACVKGRVLAEDRGKTPTVRVLNTGPVLVKHNQALDSMA